MIIATCTLYVSIAIRQTYNYYCILNPYILEFIMLFLLWQYCFRRFGVNIERRFTLGELQFSAIAFILYN